MADMETKKWTIKAIRVDLEKSQAEFAEIIGKSLPTYCNKENGKIKFTFDEVQKISLYSGIPLSNIEV